MSPLQHKPEPRFLGGVRRGFFYVFTCFLGVLVLSTLFWNPHYSHPLVGTLTAMAGWLLLFVGLFWLCRRFVSPLQKYERLFLLLFWLLLTLTQVVFYWQLAVYPTRDFERVFTGAVNFSVNGFIEEPYLDYFYKYPNNMPLTILLQFLFRAFHRLGFSQFYLLGVLAGGVCVQLCYLFTYLCCRRLFGVFWGFSSLFLLWLCLPLHCYIGVFYTDTFTLPFIPLAFYLYLRLLAEKDLSRRFFLYALLAGSLAVGTKLKYSVVIVLVALLIDLALRKSWKPLLVLAGGFLACFILVSALFNAYMYAHFLNKTLAQDRATPFSSWVMMGLAGDGGHNPEDNYLIWGQPTQEGKHQAAVAEIKNRLGRHTPASYAAFLWQKALHSFGSGNLDYTALVADSPVRQSFLVECVSENGRHFLWFNTLVQGYHCALFSLVGLCGALCALKKDTRGFVPCLSIFGLLVFLLFWESGQRYLTNYYGMYILAAITALALCNTNAPARHPIDTPHPPPITPQRT